MEVKTLGELCNIVSGGTPSRSKVEFWKEGTIPWIKIGNIKEKYVNEADEYITQAGLDGSSAKMFAKGTVLYTIFATLGEVGILGIDACTNQAIAGLTIKDTNQLNTDYLYYYLKSKKNYVNKISRGVAQNNINMSMLRSFELPLPEISKQEEIVAILDKVFAIINDRQHELQKLDELIKSRFIEMFGTVKENPYNFPTATLKEVCHKITDGKHGGCEQEANSGYYYIGAREIYDGAIHYDTAPQITYADFTKDYRRCNIEQGDMVIVNTGATIGKSAIAVSPLTERTLLQKSVALLKVKTDMVSAEFLRYCYMANPSMYMVKSASAQPNLLLSKMNATVIYLPPRELQEQFAAFVAQVDKSKFSCRRAGKVANFALKCIMEDVYGVMDG